MGIAGGGVVSAVPSVPLGGGSGIVLPDTDHANPDVSFSGDRVAGVSAHCEEC